MLPSKGAAVATLIGGELSTFNSWWHIRMWKSPVNFRSYPQLEPPFDRAHVDKLPTPHVDMYEILYGVSHRLCTF